jgi:hypothetical protein
VVCKTIEKNYDANQSKVDKIVSGFDAFRTYSFSSSLGTTIYGTLILVKTKNKINPARHETICFLWLYISFEKYYDTYASDASGTITKQYSRFENGIFRSE